MRKDQLEAIRSYVRFIAEASRRVREVDVSDGTRVLHGSDEHVADLQRRIDDLVGWRDRQKRGSEARANYSRLIQRLRAELASAERARAVR